MAKNPKAIILSGGPSSVYAEGAPQVDRALFETGVPTFGICYGFQAMAAAAGRHGCPYRNCGVRPHPSAGDRRRTALRRAAPRGLGLDVAQRRCFRCAQGFSVTAGTSQTPIAAFENVDAGLYGVQFHPEVLHTERGLEVMKHFLYDGAGCRPTWTMVNIVDEQVARIRAQVGDGRAVCGLSGGVDSAVAAALVQRAIGDRLTACSSTTGCCARARPNRSNATLWPRRRAAQGGRRVQAVPRRAGRRDRSRDQAQGDRPRVHRVFEEAAREVIAEADAHGETVEFLVQGTLYPDVVESGGGEGAANIKSHHNVGGLPDDLQFGLVEPAACAVQGRGAQGRS